MTNVAQLANELRGTLAERLLVSISAEGGLAERYQLEKWADGDEFATSAAVQELTRLGLRADRIAGRRGDP
jgi:hypothetical protein